MHIELSKDTQGALIFVRTPHMLPRTRFQPTIWRRIPHDSHEKHRVKGRFDTHVDVEFFLFRLYPMELKRARDTSVVTPQKQQICFSNKHKDTRGTRRKAKLQAGPRLSLGFCVCSYFYLTTWGNCAARQMVKKPSSFLEHFSVVRMLIKQSKR